MKLRDYQLEDLGKIKAKYGAGVRRMLVKWATGTGKTVLFSALPDFMGFQKRVMVLDHRTELTDQALDKLTRWNPGRTVGVEMGARRSNGEQLVVAGNATVGRVGSPRLLQFDPLSFDALVVDEAHHSVAQSYRTVIDHFTKNPALLVLGVTATPNRADGSGLGEVFEEIVADRDILFGIRNGWLADVRGVRIKTGVDLNSVHTKAGDFDQQELGSTVNTFSRNDLIARSWLEHAKDRRTVFFAVDIQHSKDLAGAFQRYGVNAQALWGADPDRAKKLEEYGKGNLQVLVNCQVLTEGWDNWQTSCIGIARPTQSEGLYTQMVGRGTRIPDGIGNLKEAQKRGPVAKDDCILLDYVDATSRHSLVTLPTLFGMNQNADLKGKKITQVVDEIEEAKKRNPALDITKIEDITKLKAYAEAVDLFKVDFPPEIIQLSHLQWHKTRPNAYAVALLNGESVVVIKDILDRWHIDGTVNSYTLEDVKPTLDEAIREADYRVRLLGGRGLLTLATRAEFRPKVAPSPEQLKFCQRLRIVVPEGATKAEVQQKISKVLGDRNKGRAVGRTA